jgi:hypothetical protein
MMTSKNKNECDLCALTVEVDGFKLKTTAGEKSFCCEGCKGIYQMLHEKLILPDSEQSKQDAINPTD